MRTLGPGARLAPGEVEEALHVGHIHNHCARACNLRLGRPRLQQPSPPRRLHAAPRPAARLRTWTCLCGMHGLPSGAAGSVLCACVPGLAGLPDAYNKECVIPCSGATPAVPRGREQCLQPLQQPARDACSASEADCATVHHTQQGGLPAAGDTQAPLSLPLPACQCRSHASAASLPAGGVRTCCSLRPPRAWLRLLSVCPALGASCGAYTPSNADPGALAGACAAGSANCCSSNTASSATCTPPDGSPLQHSLLCTGF